MEQTATGQSHFAVGQSCAISRDQVKLHEPSDGSEAYLEYRENSSKNNPVAKRGVSVPIDLDKHQIVDQNVPHGITLNNCTGITFNFYH